MKIRARKTKIFKLLLNNCTTIKILIFTISYYHILFNCQYKFLNKKNEHNDIDVFL